MKRFILAMIRYYQRTFSPDHGPMKFMFPHGYCKFHPTCSQYGYESFDRHGVIKGAFMTLWRILRCNPWSKGGEDPVPELKKSS